MTILITGSNGYIARNLIRKLKDCTVVYLNRNVCDLTDIKEVDKFFKDKYFDVCVHTANVGGSRLTTDPPNTIQQNLLMVHNLLAQPIGRLLSIGSGAELGRPETSYGISKQLVDNLLEFKNLKKVDCHNLRVFAVFNEDELDTRFIKSSLIKYINKQPIIIDRDKYMDFIYMDDFIEIVQRMLIMCHPYLTECCYTEKYKLSDIANIINELDNYKVPIIINDSCLNTSYCGSGDGLWFDTLGLRKGIAETYNKLVEKLK